MSRTSPPRRAAWRSAAYWSNERRALVAGGAAFAVTAGAIEALKAAGKAESGGMFGPGTLQADLNILLELLLVAGLTLGIMLARRGSIEAHRLNQTVWVMVNTALIVCIMAGSMAAFKIPSLRALRDIGNALTVLHALAGTFTVLAGSLARAPDERRAADARPCRLVERAHARYASRVLAGPAARARDLLLLVRALVAV